MLILFKGNRAMEKEQYIFAQMEVIEFEAEDILTGSPSVPELPFVPEQ